MWTNPYTWKEGCCIGSGLLAVGMILQWVVGEIEWSLMAWPMNGILVVLLLLVLLLLHLLRDHLYPVRYLSTSQAAVPAILFSAALTLVMGITGWMSMLRFWPLVLCYLWMVIIMGLAVLKRLSRIRSWNKSNIIKNLAFLTNHLGLMLALVAATAGSADMHRLKMSCQEGEVEWRAMDEEARAVIELPLAIELKKFILEVYPTTYEPKRYISKVIVYTQGESPNEAIIEVNHPLSIAGWTIYQHSYQVNQLSTISIFELVRDPWLPAVYVGLIMMVLGAIFMFIFAGESKLKPEEL